MQDQGRSLASSERPFSLEIREVTVHGPFLVLWGSHDKSWELTGHENTIHLD
jgi:hypothetical protein